MKDEVRYLGLFPVDIENTPYKDYTKEDWIEHYLFRYGQIDGSHHKAWVLDQIARIIKNTKMEISIRKWSNGKGEYSICTHDEPSKEYLDWVERYCDGDNYSYDVGIAP